MRARTLAAGLTVAVISVAMTACGSNSLGGPTDSKSAVPSVTADAKLHAELPADIAKSGTIVVGTDPSYAPSEITQGTTIVGFDIDLFNAVAAKLGVKADYKAAQFDSIIAGVTAKKYNMGVSSFSVTADRMKQVDMVSYFNAGTQWATLAGNPKHVDINNACGKTVAVQTGTTQQLDDLPVRQKKCGKTPIKILPYDKQDQATAALVAGRADAMLADSPVIAYAVKQSNGKLATLGSIYASAPYGYVVPKNDGQFAKAIAEALTELKADGTYDKILAKWGVQSGAISSFAVDPKP